MPTAKPDWYDDPDWATLRNLDEEMFSSFDPDWRDDVAPNDE